MNSAKSSQGQVADSAEPAEAYPLLDFSFPGLEGLSPDAMKTHLELYAGYVKEANAVSAALTDTTLYSGVNAVLHARESLSRRLAFELSGVRLHELFFEQINPRRAAKSLDRDADFMNCLARSFGGFNNWVEDIKLLGETRGPGWVATYQDEDTGRLNNLWIDLHHLAIPATQHLVFALDLWEHAYWNDYGAKGRPKYIADLLRQTDWAVVNQRMTAASA